MANYKFPTAAQACMVALVNDELNKYVNLARLGFPLSIDEMQAQVCAPDNLRLLTELQRRGVPDLPDRSRFTFHADAAQSGSSHEALITVDAAVDLLVDHDPIGIYYRSNDLTTKTARAFRRLDLDLLSEDRREQFVRWFNRVLRAQRIRDKLVGPACSLIMECPTVGHMRARAPFLIPLFQDRDPELRDRFNEGGKLMKHYAWSDPIEPRIATLHAALEHVLASTSMLAVGATTSPEGASRASVLAYCEAGA